MTQFKLLNSLTESAVVEAEQPVAEAEQPVAEAVAPAGRVRIDEIELRGGPKSAGYERGDELLSFQASIYVSYELSDDSEIQLTAVGELVGGAEFEDSRFSAPYGSTTAYGGDAGYYFASPDFREVKVPQIADNIDVFRLPPEQAQRVIHEVVEFITNLDEDTIGKFVDIDACSEKVGKVMNS